MSRSLLLCLAAFLSLGLLTQRTMARQSASESFPAGGTVNSTNMNITGVQIDTGRVDERAFRLSLSFDTTHAIRLSWTAPAHAAVAEYFVYRATLSFQGAPMRFDSTTLIDSTTNQFFVDGYPVSHSGIYGYCVVAKDTSGTLVPSNIITLNMGTGVSSAFINLKAHLENGIPQLSWDLSQNTTFAKYYIYFAVFDPRSTGDSHISLNLIDSTTSQSYAHLHPPATTYGYIYGVTGVSGQRTIMSNQVTLRVFSPLTLSAYTEADGRTVSLHWTPPSDDHSVRYFIYRQFADSTGRIDSTHWSLLDSTSADEFEDLPTGTAGVVAYRVQAIVISGNPMMSNVVRVPWRIQLRPQFTLRAELDGDGGIELSWNDAVGFSVSKYYLYRVTLPRGTSFVDTTFSFAIVDSTTDRSIKNMAPFDQSNAFAYFVQAIGSGQSAHTNIASLMVNSVPTHSRIRFVSDPVRDGQVGVLYTYSPVVSSTDSSAIFQWQLREHPDGMTIDSASGRVQWTPSRKGSFDVQIVVSSNSGARANQEYEIIVAGLSGIVQGTVTDTLGNPVFAIVKLFKRNADEAFGYSVKTDSTGSFRFNHVDAGSYIAFAAPLTDDFIPQWYFQKNSPNQATPIVVADSTTVTIGFQLQSRFIILPQFTLGGAVRDTLGRPINGAVVTWARAGFLLNSSKSSDLSEESGDNFRDIFAVSPATGSSSQTVNQNSSVIFRAVTDSLGRFSVRIPQGQYIGFAFAQGFRGLFFNNETDLLSADLLNLTSDTAGISFSLQSLPPVALGSISGAVEDTNLSTGVQSRIVAFHKNPDRAPDAYFTDSDTAGAYVLDNLPPGNYIILAIPLGHYVPSFYSVNGTTINWKLATPIAVNGNSVSGINIIVKAASTTSNGYTYIQGTVSTTTPLSGRIAKTTAAVGVNGSVVYAADSSGTIAGYGITNASGSYLITGLAPRTYSVTTYRIGYDNSTPVSASPSYDVNGNPQPANASLSINSSVTSVSGANNALPTTYSLNQNYPNPFNPSTTISFTLPLAGRVKLTIYNIIGQQIATLVNGDFTAGAHAVVWNGRNDRSEAAASGVYFYRLETKSFLAVRKMILLK